MEVLEYDQSGALQNTFIKKDEKSALVVKRALNTKNYFERFLDVFMPAGYPTSVTDDYLAYQTYDSLQAFASSIAGMLSSRAVLEGIGVGDHDSHPTTALLLSVFQESFGRIITIVFASRFGSALEPECKMWRLAADVFNDAALILDCLSPAFPKQIRVIIFSSASMLRALCGVAAGSAKASLSSHFAKTSNLGDVNAKDSSQETVISLVGMLVGSVVVSKVSSVLWTWIVLVILMLAHLGLNYLAVRSVCMRNLNRQRAGLVFSHLIASDTVMSPKEVALTERIWEADGGLRWKGDQKLGYARIGVDWKSCVDVDADMEPIRLLEIFREENYVLALKGGQNSRRKSGLVMIHIALKDRSKAADQLKGWLHSLIVAKTLFETPTADTASVIISSLHQTNKVFDGYIERLSQAGWTLESLSLETDFGPRIRER